MATPTDFDVQQAIRDHPQGVIVTTTVVPGASKSEIVGLHGATLRVRVAAPPEDGKANKAVIELLAEGFGCRVDLLSGARSRVKAVLLRDAERVAVAAWIVSISR